MINCLQTVWCLTKVYSTKKSRFRYSKFKVSYQAAPSGKHGDTLFSLLSTTGQHSFESFKRKNVVLKKGWIVIHVVCTSYWSNNNHYLRDVQWYFTVRLPTNHRSLGYMYKEIHCSSAFWLTLQSYKSEKTFCFF